jgi:hypothetical protein
LPDSSLVTTEMYVPDSYIFLDAHPSYAIIIHKTASPGMATAESIGAFFQKGSNGRHVSVHYVVGKDGHIVQCVREKDGAGGNAALPVEPGRSSLFAQPINWNLRTISIEHVDDSINNTESLTQAQQNASFALVADIARRKNIPSTLIVGHNALQPQSKAFCPGNYPLSQLRTYVASHTTGGVIPPVSSLPIVPSPVAAGASAAGLGSVGFITGGSQTYTSVLAQTHAELVASGGFKGIADAIDTAEQFPGWIDLSSSFNAGPFQLPDPAGFVRSIGATITDNFVPFIIRSGIISLGLFLLVLLLIKVVEDSGMVTP